MSVTFHFLQSTPLKQRRKIKLLIKRLFLHEGKALESLEVIFCSDAYLLDMNQKFLSHDYFTDIITFNLSEGPQPVTGEVYISVDTAKINAREYNVLISNELLRLIVHGSLHLCGYKDKTKAQKILMSSKEDAYLREFETL